MELSVGDPLYYNVHTRHGKQEIILQDSKEINWSSHVHYMGSDKWDHKTNTC